MQFLMASGALRGRGVLAAGLCLAVAATRLSGAGAESEPRAPAAQRAGGPGEVRGLWVLRTSLNSPRSIDAAVRIAETSGFNTLLVQVRGRGEAYYQSAIEPRATDLDAQPASFDPLAYAVAAGHRAGLRVHAWVNLDLISSAATLPRSREHVVSRHPEWLMVPRPLAAELRNLDPRSPAYVGQLARWTRAASASVEGLYLSPIPAASQDYTAAVVAEIVSRYDLDGLHLDYARYPNDLFDYSPRALEAFRSSKVPGVSARERQRLDQAALGDPAAWPNMFPDGWATFRRERLTTLVKRLHGAAKAARPDIVVSAAVAPDPKAARDRVYQDWPAWAASRLLDAVCPMAYTTDLAEFTAAVTQAQIAAAGLPVWAGIGAWQLPVDRTVEHVRIARRSGAAGVLLFSYDALSEIDLKPSAYFASLREALLGTFPD